MDNYLSSFSRRGESQQSGHRRPSRRSHRSSSAPPSSFPSSLSFLQPSFPPPFFFLFSLIDAFGWHRGNSSLSAPLFLPAPFSSCSSFAPLSSLSFFLPPFCFLLSFYYFLPSFLLLFLACSSSFLNAPSSSFLSFLLLVSSVGSGCIGFFPLHSDSSLRRYHCYYDACDHRRRLSTTDPLGTPTKRCDRRHS